MCPAKFATTYPRIWWRSLGPLSLKACLVKLHSTVSRKPNGLSVALSHSQVCIYAELRRNALGIIGYYEGHSRNYCLKGRPNFMSLRRSSSGRILFGGPTCGLVPSTVLRRAFNYAAGSIHYAENLKGIQIGLLKFETNGLFVSPGLNLGW